MINSEMKLDLEFVCETVTIEEDIAKHDQLEKHSYILTLDSNVKHFVGHTKTLVKLYGIDILRSNRQELFNKLLPYMDSQDIFEAHFVTHFDEILDRIHRAGYTVKKKEKLMDTDKEPEKTVTHTVTALVLKQEVSVALDQAQINIKLMAAVRNWFSKYGIDSEGLYRNIWPEEMDELNSILNDKTL